MKNCSDPRPPGRLLFVADVPASRPVSGAEQVLHQQTRTVARLCAGAWALTRSNGADATRWHDADGVTEASYPADPGSLPSFLWSLARETGPLFDRLAEGAGFDCVVAHQPFTALALLASGRLRGVPLVYVFHSPGHEEYLLDRGHLPRWRTSLPALGRRRAERLCLRRAAVVLTLSDYMAEKAVAVHGIDRERIVVNPGGVDQQRFQPPADRARLKQRLGFPADTVHLLTIRNLEPRMGLDRLVTAIRLLLDRGLRVSLAIGGNGPLRPALQDQIDRLDLAGRVRLTGFLPDEAMADWYGAADFFIVPTRALEGFGLVTPESLACGTPVLGTPVGGTREILGRFDPAFLFAGNGAAEMADGIARAMQAFADQDRYLDLRCRCTAFARECFSWRRHAETLLAAVAGARD
ncbi:MAG: glycosyltransferase family 4 protein [Thermodesulfobacteriota bacterium]